MSGSQKKRKNIILSVYRDGRTVFRLIDIAMLTGETDRLSLGKKLNYYVKKEQLQSPRKGIYTKPGYSPEELACRLYAPSYISLEYVLQKTGIIFQYDQRITMVGYLNRQIDTDGISIQYRKIKGEVLANGTGIKKQSPYITQALPERAFLDLLYLDPDFYFDNLNPLDKQFVMKLLPAYHSQALIRRTKNLLSDV